MHTNTLKQLSEGLAKGEFSSVEITQHYLNRIKKYNPQLNALITITEEQALTAAQKADERIAQKQFGSLTGLPIIEKDMFCTQGVKTTAASNILNNFIPPYDATTVKKFKDAGTVLLGKANLDEFAMGSSNENSYYGSVKNPWNIDYVPGGSSGGSAAAVAAMLAPAATGTDTGGSIRQPASLSGITGIKPTYGRVSRYGIIAYASSLDQAGVMARTSEDCAMLLNAMAGFDEKDSTCANIPVPDYTATLNKSIKGLKVGLPKEFFDHRLNPQMAEKIQQAIKELEKLGAELIEVELPHSNLSIHAYYVIAPAEASSNLSRYDGVRYGHRCENPQNLEDLYLRSRGEGFGDEVKRRIITGTYLLSSGYYDAYYMKAQKIRRLISNDFQEAFKKVDVIAGPVSPTTAFRLGEKCSDPVEMYLSDIYTISVNLAGLPGMSVPAGFLNGLPVGLQLIGNHFNEAQLLNVAHQYQMQTNWHSQLPKSFK
jgi:aspartyl-tRNA(Asn)/glutamyl-tRNA(Gln) amidotransferase subunit A